MADRITLNFAANTADAERGTDRMAGSLDDVSTKLDDLGTAGEDAGNKTAGSLDDVGTATENVGGKLGDLGGVAKDVLEGDLAGAARGGVAALTGLAAAVPVVGAAVGTGLALAANTFIGIWEKAAKTNEDRIKAMFDDFIKSGNDFASVEFVNSSIHDIIDDTDRLNEVKRDAAEAGVRLSLALRAEAGDQVALASVLTTLRSKREDLTAAQEAFIAKNGDSSAAIDEQIGGLDLLETALNSYGTAADTAGTKADVYRQATDDAGVATGNLTDKLNAIPASIFASVEVDTSTAQAKVDSFIAGLKSRKIPIVADVVDRYGRSVL